MSDRAVRLEDLPELVTIGEACNFLRIGTTLAYELVRAGKLKKVEGLGKAIRIPRGELERLVRGEEQPERLRAVK
jgi:excisionase family DNA binding protein